MKKSEGTREMHPGNISARAIIYGIVVNIVLGIVKLLTGIFGNSYALIADAIESGGDGLTSLVVWIGLKTSAAPPDEDHPYGHGKAEPIAAIFVAIVLIISAVYIAIEGIRYIRTPHSSPEPYTLIVLGLVIIVKESLARYFLRKSVETGSIALGSDAQHQRSDAITSAAAFIGISIALIGGEGYEAADDWAALIASGVIAYNGYSLFRPAFSEIMDEAPPTTLTDEIREIASNVNRVKGVDKCLVRKMGFEYFVDIHIIVDGNITVREGHDIAHRVKDAIRSQKTNVFDVLTHIEPE